MCGIVGVVSNSKVSSNIYDMTSCLHHRGPDAGGIYKNELNTVALGHRRLSIIDLSTGANQPFKSANSRYVVVFNGEIYNYKQLRGELSVKHGVIFRTNSDTEVIAEGFGVWGNGMAEKLDGMFAVAIFDCVESNLFLIRDRVGKKPLYYFRSENYFAFASEIKSLLKDPFISGRVRVNTSSISTFLHLGYIPEPNTVYSEIFKFPAGHIGHVSATVDFSIHPFWNINQVLTEKKKWSAMDAKQHFKKALDISVEKRMISDVPLGTFLSGGTDSSLVTAFAVKHAEKRLKTFSIGFRDSKYNESQYARAVAAHLGTDHRELILFEKEAIDLLEKYTSHFDEPFADTSAIPTMLVSRMASEEVKVVLTGDGGDELFQGYGAYRWANRLNSRLMKASKPILYTGLKTLGNNRLKRVGHLLEPNLIGNIRSHIFSQEQYFFSQDEIKNKLLRNKGQFSPFEYQETSYSILGYSEAEKQAIFDFNFYLKDDLLVKVDRASMYYGLECRCPLLDHKLVEFAFSLPDSLKYKNGSAKWLLKDALSEHLPTDLINRPKWGFSVPLAKWLRSDLRFLIEQYLNPIAIEELGLVNVSYVQKLIRDFLAGQDYLYNRLWLLIVLHRSWLDKNYRL